MSKWSVLSALALLVTLIVWSAPAVALERCVVADPQGPTLNVREKPRGKLVGRLNNGRAAYIFDSEKVDYGPGPQPSDGVNGYRYEGNYHYWSLVAVETGGALKSIGWVYYEHLNCRQPDIEPGTYPLIFGPGFDSDASAHRRDGFANSDKYPNHCYYYGDGGNDVSVSDAVLASFKKRGFSLSSLCLGLISKGVLFNPETGKRLPSYMYANLANVKKLEECKKPRTLDEERRAIEKGAFRGCSDLMDPYADVVSDVFLLDLPDCFKAGLPYSDCAMNYDMGSGRKNTSAERAFFKWQGQEIEGIMTEAMKQNVTCVWRNCSQVLTNEAYNAFDGYSIEQPLHKMKPWKSPLAQQLAYLSIGTGITAYDISRAFPRGFGYAIGPSGEAGPETNLQSVKLAVAQKDRATRAEVEALEDVPTSP